MKKLKFSVVAIGLMALVMAGCSDPVPSQSSANPVQYTQAQPQQSGLDQSDLTSAAVGAAAGYMLANKTTSNYGSPDYGYRSAPATVHKTVIINKVTKVYKNKPSYKRNRSYGSRSYSASSRRR